MRRSLRALPCASLALALLTLGACAPMDGADDDAGVSDAGGGGEGSNPPWLPATVDLTLSDHDGVSPSLPSVFEGREGLYWPSVLSSYGANDDDGHCLSGLFSSFEEPLLRTYDIAVGGDAEATFSFSTGCRQSEEFEGRYETTYTWRAVEGTLEVTAVQPRLRVTLTNVRMEPSGVSSEPTEGTFVINGSGELRPVQ